MKTLIIVHTGDEAVQPGAAAVDLDHEGPAGVVFGAQGAGGGAGEEPEPGAVRDQQQVPAPLRSSKMQLLVAEELFCVIRTVVSFRIHGVFRHLRRLARTGSSWAPTPARSSSSSTRPRSAGSSRPTRKPSARAAAGASSQVPVPISRPAHSSGPQGQGGHDRRHLEAEVRVRADTRVIKSNHPITKRSAQVSLALHGRGRPRHRQRKCYVRLPGDRLRRGRGQVGPHQCWRGQEEPGLL